MDEKNGNDLWMDAINREMENLKVAFDILEDGAKVPVGYHKASGHLVFDVRMTLERKARWVKDGHKTPEPEWSTFAGVVSRESVRIALTCSALNDLPVCAYDLQNSYLKARSSEKHYVVCGPEFGLENVGKYAIIVRALMAVNLLELITGDMFVVLWKKWASLHAKLTLMTGFDQH